MRLKNKLDNFFLCPFFLPFFLSLYTYYRDPSLYNKRRLSSLFSLLIQLYFLIVDLSQVYLTIMDLFHIFAHQLKVEYGEDDDQKKKNRKDSLFLCFFILYILSIYSPIDRSIFPLFSDSIRHVLSFTYRPPPLQRTTS